MSVSMMSSPSVAESSPSFKPTLVSDYFFNEPPSPSLQELQPASTSPDIDSPPPVRKSSIIQHHVGEAIPEVSEDICMEEVEGSSEGRATSSRSSGVSSALSISSSNPPSRTPSAQPQVSSKPDDIALMKDVVPGSVGPKSPTHFVSHAMAPPSATSTPTPTHQHQQVVRQNLIAAAMSIPATASTTRPPPIQPQVERKYSTATTVSAASTAPSSGTNSPTTPTENYQFQSADQSVTGSTTQTPSPPPLHLPQAAAIETQSQPAQQQLNNQTPPVTPSRHSHHSTVPAAASHISPVQLPPNAHAQQAPSTHRHHHHHAQHQYSATPHQPSRRTHHHEHANSTYSNPVTPPAPSRHVRAPSNEAGVEYVGPFILGPVLGRGCTGTVRLGTHKRNKFEVAFKIIEKKYLQSDAKLWTKVKREIVILKLIEHPHVLKLYDVLETEHRLYLVLEHVRGGELFDFIVSKGRLDRHESLRIAAQIVMGLEHCHAHGICHRDLKPENLLLDEAHNIKIADFGMAQLMKKDGILKTSCGSPHYASPEIIEGSTYDAKCTDVWSIGVILYALITGSLPFDHDNIPTLLTMVTKGHYTTPAYVPADVAHLISRMLTVDPTKRITIPEIKKHICFKGKSYFTDFKDPISIESITNHIKQHPQSHPNHGVHAKDIPLHTTKKHKVNSRERLAREESSEEDMEHAWRKTSMHGKSNQQPTFHDLKDYNPSVSAHSMARSSGTVALESDDVIDEGVLQDLESLGLGPRDGNRDELKKRIRGNDGKEPSLEQVFYKLLKQRKMARLDQLRILSPKVKPMPHPIETRRHQPSSHAHASHRRDARASESQPCTALHPHAQNAGTSLPGSTIGTPQLVNNTQPPPMQLPNLAELSLPPAFPADAMQDVQAAGSPRSGSMYQQLQPSPLSDASVTTPIQSSIFSGANAFASTLFDLTAQQQQAAAQQQKSNDTIMTDSVMQGSATPISPPVVTSTSHSMIAAGMPVAVGVAAAVTGAQKIASHHQPTNLHHQAIPPVHRHYSDGSVPDSIMAPDSSASSYYMAMSKANPPPTLQLSSQPQREGDIEELANSPLSGDSSASGGSYTPLPQKHPNERGTTFQFTRSYQDSTNVSPAIAPISSSAQVSPVPTKMPFHMQRRMSTPQASTASNDMQSFHLDAPIHNTHTSQPGGVSRQLFATDDTEMMMDGEERNMSAAQQQALDHYRQQITLATSSSSSGPAQQEMLDIDKSASAPMHALAHLTSPPILTLPRGATPHISVRVTTNESSGSDADEGDRIGILPSRRDRAYSQDETNLIAKQGAPTDRIASNVRTPLLTPHENDETTELPTYSTSPRFHRVKFHEQGKQQSAPQSASSRAPQHMPKHHAHANSISAMQQPPPSPHAKQSWFSSVFGSANFSLFDRLKGKRSNNPAATHPTDATSASSSAGSSFPNSPLMSPHRGQMATSSSGVHTKRAVLTIANELSRIFASSNIQFVHSNQYKFSASYAGMSNAPEIAVPPMPMPMIPMQRAVSTPDEQPQQYYARTDRPRSQSITAQDGIDAKSPDTAHRAAMSYVPSTPKPTPTARLGQPLQLSQYPAPLIPSPSPPSSTATDVLERASSGSSVGSSRGFSPAMSQQSSVTPTSAASSSTPRNRMQMFGPATCRFSVSLSECPGDLRLIHIVRKSGDIATFNAIRDHIITSLHL